MIFLCIFLLAIANVIAEDFYSFTVKDWQGNDVSLEEYRGKVKDLLMIYRSKRQRWLFILFQVSLVVNVSFAVLL